MPHSIPLSACREVALRVAPELEASAIRFVRHDPSWPLPGGDHRIDAYALHGRFLPLRKHLEGAGEWREEWGSTVVFVGKPTLAVLLHELAHLLPAQLPVPDASESPSDEVVTAQAIKRMKADGDVDLPKPWVAHGGAFVRIVLHLAHRARQLGYTFEDDHLGAAGANYGMSPLWAYADALGNEPQTCIRCDFSALDILPAPPAFRELWAMDRLILEHQ